jgi:hypothetical protein
LSLGLLPYLLIDDCLKLLTPEIPLPELVLKAPDALQRLDKEIIMCPRAHSVDLKAIIMEGLPVDKPLLGVER